MSYKIPLLLAGSVVAAFSVTSATANGLGENTPYQFRSPNERQVGINSENVRLNFESFERGVGSSYGIGTSQTGNTITIDIDGDGDNDITVDQDSSGDQDAAAQDTVN